MKGKEPSWFWILQISAWILIGFMNFMLQYFTTDLPRAVVWRNFISIGIGGFILTTLYRYYLKRKKIAFNLSMKSFIGNLLIATVLLSLMWLGLMALIFFSFADQYRFSFRNILHNLFPTTAILLIWTLCYLGYHLMRKYHHQEIEKWKMEAEIKNIQLENLKAQVNPHFIFNALNNIRALILEDHQLARQMLTKFSEVLRYALQHAEDIEITIAEEIGILRQYLELVKIQYEERLTFSISADETLLQQKIPPMVLQLLVENAVKHGISSSVEGGRIDVQVGMLNQEILLTVRNTGSLKRKEELEDNLGLGIKNIIERLGLIYGDRAGISITEESPEVVVVINIKRST
ncbi:sensor histidine kinase [Pedobacter caeni]|nr:histidine kinase [Pedobacter caeni]